MINLHLDNIDIYEKKTKSFGNLVRLNSFIIQNYENLDVNLYIKTNDEKEIIKFINNLNIEEKFLQHNIFINKKLITQFNKRYKPNQDPNNFNISYDLKIKGAILKDLFFIKRLNDLINKLIFYCPKFFDYKKLINIILFKSKIRVLNLKKETNLKMFIKSNNNMFLFTKSILKLIYLVRFCPYIKEFLILDQNLFERIYIPFNEILAVITGFILRAILFLNYLLRKFFLEKNKKKEVLPIYCTPEQIISSKLNLIRWNDGESALLYGRSIYFQRTSLKIIFQLFIVLLKYKFCNSNFFLALPNKRFKRSTSSQSKLILFLGKGRICDPTEMRFNRQKYKDFLIKHSLYFNSTIVISSDSDREFFSKLKNCIHMSCPSANAFAYFDYIFDLIASYLDIKQLSMINPKVLVLVSLGPTSKILISKLSETYRNSQFLDTGHLLI